MDILRSPLLSPQARILLAIMKGYNKVEEIAARTGISYYTAIKYVSVMIAGGMIWRKKRSSYIVTEHAMKMLRELVEQITETMKNYSAETVAKGEQ